MLTKKKSKCTLFRSTTELIPIYFEMEEFSGMLTFFLTELEVHCIEGEFNVCKTVHFYTVITGEHVLFRMRSGE